MFQKIKRITACLFAGSFAWALQAQQLPYQTQFRQIYSYINPAAVNSDYFLYEYNLNVNASHRMQWIGQPQTPRTMLINGEYIHKGTGNFSLASGAMLMRDRVGPLGLTGIYGKLAALFSGDPYFGAFSAGLTAGYAQYRILSDRIVWQHLDDPNRPLDDVKIGKPEIGLGVYYFKRIRSGRLRDDNIYVGLSAPQLWAVDAIAPSGAGPLPNQVFFRRVPHVFATSGWYHFFNEDAFLEIGLWAKYVRGARPNIHITGRFQATQSFWVGGGFNPNGLAHLEVGFNIPGFLAENGRLKLGYAFDYNISAFDLPLGSSHEIHIAYLLDTRR